jgi:predicted CopG family antitoxin
MKKGDLVVERQVDEAIKQKRTRFKIYKALNNESKSNEVEKAKATYNEAKLLAKSGVWNARTEAEKDKFANILPNDGNIFKIAKQLDRTNQNVVGEKGIKNDAGELSLSDEKMNAWVEHCARLLHVEFEWPSDLILPEAAPVEGPAPPVTLDIIWKALRKMKRGNSAGLSGVIGEMLKAPGEEGITILRHLTEKAFSEGVTPMDWEESYIINLHKGKGDALDPLGHPHRRMRSTASTVIGVSILQIKL